MADGTNQSAANGSTEESPSGFFISSSAIQPLFTGLIGHIDFPPVFHLERNPLAASASTPSERITGQIKAHFCPRCTAEFVCVRKEICGWHEHPLCAACWRQVAHA